MEYFVVNIGRQLGSGGREIGERLAHRLNISFYDKELIQLASKKRMNALLKALWADCLECVSRL